MPLVRVSLKRAMVRFRRQRDDEVEIKALPFVQLLEGDRLVPRNIDADFGHDGDRERIEFAFAHAGRADIDRAAEHLPEQRRPPSASAPN